MKYIITPSEKSWLRIFRVLTPVIAGIVLFQSFVIPTSPQPLADAGSLQVLINGLELPVPEDNVVGEYLGVTVVPPPLATLVQNSHILGDSTGANKRIEVDLSSQKVYAFEGDRKVYEFLVSTGKYFPTPTGEFTIWVKVRSQKMSGGSKALGTYYYLPNVPYVMFFANDKVSKSRGFSLHGAYWHSNWGHPMSHGCVNMRIEDAKTLYEWASPVVTNPKAWSTLSSSENPGTKVIIYGVTPKQ